jgi:3-oxoacyl-[acyl-carrier protein] reductase
MDLGLKGKVALITRAGSQKGFGRGIALTLAKECCDIIASDINLEGAELTAVAVREWGCRALAWKADVTNRDQSIERVARL